MNEGKSKVKDPWMPKTERHPFEGFASNEELLDAARRLERYLAKLREWDHKHKLKMKFPRDSLN